MRRREVAKMGYEGKMYRRVPFKRGGGKWIKCPVEKTDKRTEKAKRMCFIILRVIYPTGVSFQRNGRLISGLHGLLLCCQNSPPHNISDQGTFWSQSHEAV